MYVGMISSCMFVTDFVDSGFKFAQVELSTSNCFRAVSHVPNAFVRVFTEAVLFVLLQEFKFEPSEKPIAWNYASVQFPSIAGKNGPEMPLKVSLLRS